MVTLGRESKGLSHSFIRDHRLQEDKGKRRIDIAFARFQLLILQSVHLTLTGNTFETFEGEHKVITSASSCNLMRKDPLTCLTISSPVPYFSLWTTFYGLQFKLHNLKGHKEGSLHKIPAAHALECKHGSPSPKQPQGVVVIIC